MPMGMGMMASRSGGHFSIYGATFDPSLINFSIKQNSIERWDVRANNMMHPFHVHGVRFQVVSQNSQPPYLQNRGWKDTLLVDGQVELLMKFERSA
jgi:blue copper oxidase